MRYIHILYFFLGIISCAAIEIFFRLKNKKGYGKVIILNGPSCAGKSSIQKKFQSLMMPQLWIKLGIDNLFDTPLPDITLDTLPFWQSPNSIRWVQTTEDKEKNKVITLYLGNEGEKVIRGMHSALAAYAKNGCNVIVDYILYNETWYDDLCAELAGIKTYWVKVNIPLKTLEEREAARGTSPKGHARSHYDTVYANIPYDLEVDSEKESSHAIAQKIKEYFKL
jgi:chloramphenicol 3-O phosphotransferase